MNFCCKKQDRSTSCLLYLSTELGFLCIKSIHSLDAGFEGTAFDDDVVGGGPLGGGLAGAAAKNQTFRWGVFKRSTRPKNFGLLQELLPGNVLPRTLQPIFPTRGLQ